MGVCGLPYLRLIRKLHGLGSSAVFRSFITLLVARHAPQVSLRMDPLSITSGVIAVATLAKQISNVLAGIREDWDSLPGRIHALGNEMQDFSVVLHQIAIAVEERKVSCWNDGDESTLPALLARGETALVDLKGVLESLLSAGTRKREAIPRVRLWRREQGRIAALQNDVKQVKSSMNLLLGASNSWVFLSIVALKQ